MRMQTFFFLLWQYSFTEEEDFTFYMELKLLFRFPFTLKVGDGAGGGGISLAGTEWDKKAFKIAEEVCLSFDGELGIYAFRTQLNATIKVRIERLTNK